MGRQRMEPELVRVRPGPAGTAWLVDRIGALQAGDPLRPVTVVVPSHHAGLHLRRHLAARGYANVRPTVVARLAEALGAPRLAGAGLTPLTTVTRAALVRAAIRATGGPLAQGADHAGLVDLVAALAAELRRRPDAAAAETRIRTEGTATARAALDVVADHESRRRRLRMYDDVDLLEAASAAVAQGTAALRDVGAVVVHLPARLDQPEAALLRALAARTTVVVAVPEVGDASCTAPLEAALAPALAAPSDPVAVAAAVHAVVASDPVEEVRAAVRGALAAAEREDGVPLHRSAIVYRDEETYGRLLRDTLDEAGVSYAALDGRPLIDSAAARGLLGLVRLREQDFARSAVLAWLSGLPHDRGGVLRSQARWDQLSRDAGVVRGVAQWRDRLGRLIADRERRLEELDRDPEDAILESRRAAVERDLLDARRIVEHVTAIDEATRPPADTTWEGLIRWALRLRDEYLLPDQAWSAEDREASQAVEEVVRGLEAAAVVEPAVSVGVFLRALEDGLRGRRRPEGRVGRGLLIGPHRRLLGLDVGRVQVLGAVEGAIPAGLPVDPLLAGDPLDRRAVLEADERRDWLVALAVADGGEAVVSAPQRDAGGRAVHPSPWLLDVLAGDDGTHPRASEVRTGSVAHPRLHRAGGAVSPLSLAERRELEAAAAHATGRDLRYTALALREDLPLGHALEVVRARRSSRLTVFDGVVPGVVHLPPVAVGLAGALRSATGIQTWATCPFHYLLGTVLRVQPTEDVEDERWWAIDAAERGSLIHDILERFFAEVARTGSPAPGQPYDDAAVRRLEAIAEDRFDDAHARGITGQPLVWANEREAILRDLRTLLQEDADRRGEGGWRPFAVEQAFGFDGEDGSWPPVTVPLGDGREATLRGRIDRIDAGGSGVLSVIDYKTGRKPTKAEAQQMATLDGGRHLQLAVYGRAVRDHLRRAGEAPAPAPSFYWFATTRGAFTPVPLEVDDAVEAELQSVLGGVDAGIRAGCFPLVPGPYEDFRGRCRNCAYCDYDTLCPAGRDVMATAKSASPELAPYLALQPAADVEEAE